MPLYHNSLSVSRVFSIFCDFYEISHEWGRGRGVGLAESRKYGAEVSFRCFCLGQRLSRGRGERTISNAEAPFPPPLRKRSEAFAYRCPNPSISLAGGASDSWRMIGDCVIAKNWGLSVGFLVVGRGLLPPNSPLTRFAGALPEGEPFVQNQQNPLSRQVFPAVLRLPLWGSSAQR